MSGSAFVAVVAGSVIVALLVGMRWELVDFLLDRFGALAEWWRRGARPQRGAT